MNNLCFNVRALFFILKILCSSQNETAPRNNLICLNIPLLAELKSLHSRFFCSESIEFQDIKNMSEQIVHGLSEILSTFQPLQPVISKNRNNKLNRVKRINKRRSLSNYEKINFLFSNLQEILLKLQILEEKLTNFIINEDFISTNIKEKFIIVREIIQVCNINLIHIIKEVENVKKASLQLVRDPRTPIVNKINLKACSIKLTDLRKSFQKNIKDLLNDLLSFEKVLIDIKNFGSIFFSDTLKILLDDLQKMANTLYEKFNFIINKKLAIFDGNKIIVNLDKTNFHEISGFFYSTTIFSEMILLLHEIDGYVNKQPVLELNNEDSKDFQLFIGHILNQDIKNLFEFYVESFEVKSLVDFLLAEADSLNANSNIKIKEYVEFMSLFDKKLRNLEN